MNANQSYPNSAQFMHWIMALIVISMLFLGVSMVQSLAVWQVTALKLHQSFGVLVFILVIIRLCNRVRIRIPGLPEDLPKWQPWIARTMHALLYAGMFAMPLTGWLMQSANGINVSFFGLFDLPSIISQDLALYGLFRALHGLMAWALFGLILLHIAAALFHGLIRKDGVLKSMWFSKDKNH